MSKLRTCAHQDTIKIKGASSQDGGIGRFTWLTHTTKRRITTNLKLENNQNCQKFKLYGSPTTEKLKNHFFKIFIIIQLQLSAFSPHQEPFLKKETDRRGRDGKPDSKDSRQGRS